MSKTRHRHFLFSETLGNELWRVRLGSSKFQSQNICSQTRGGAWVTSEVWCLIISTCAFQVNLSTDQDYSKFLGSQVFPLEKAMYTPRGCLIQRQVWPHDWRSGHISWYFSMPDLRGFHLLPCQSLKFPRQGIFKARAFIHPFYRLS